MRRKELRWPLVILVANCCGVALAALLWVGQKTLPAVTFEYGKQRQWVGTLEALPYPAVRLYPEHGEPSRLLLVGFGKHGADAIVSGLEGRAVRVSGSLIERNGHRMAEVAGRPVPIELPRPLDLAGKRSLGVVRLAGEIVDSKCYLGVMNPGNGKVHRGCASRCISGGVPPMLVARDGRERLYVLLADASGKPLSKAVLDFVAEPVSLEGELFTLGDWMVLHADPGSLRRE